MNNLDERGHACPTPLINTIEALKKMSIGDTIVVKVDSETPVANITRFANGKNLPVETKKISDTEYDVTIVKDKDFTTTKADEVCDLGPGKKNIVAVISSNVMGQGDETLGKNLIKAFIFALTKQEQLPNTILFYNKGAYLTTEGSESLDDLNALASQGVKIFTCGTCLEFYGLKEKLKIGEVTNMYDIVRMMEESNLVVRP